MTVRETARTWGSRGAVVIAALACVATSAPRWQLDAKPPAGELHPHGNQGLLVTVEASQQPEVTCATATRSTYQPSLPPLAFGEDHEWHGHGDFLCPPGAALGVIQIGGRGGQGGGLCSSPSAPAGAFVRVARLDAVETWSLAAASDPVPVQVGASAAGRHVSFDALIASARPLQVVAELVPGADAASLEGPFANGGRAEPAWPGGADGGADGGAASHVRHYTISMFPKQAAPPTVLAASFVLHATAYGVCPTPAPCQAPEGETVRVVSVVPASP